MGLKIMNNTSHCCVKLNSGFIDRAFFLWSNLCKVNDVFTARIGVGKFLRASLKRLSQLTAIEKWCEQVLTWQCKTCKTLSMFILFWMLSMHCLHNQLRISECQRINTSKQVCPFLEENAPLEYQIYSEYTLRTNRCSELRSSPSMKSMEIVDELENRRYSFFSKTLYTVFFTSSNRIKISWVITPVWCQSLMNKIRLKWY